MTDRDDRARRRRSRRAGGVDERGGDQAAHVLDVWGEIRLTELLAAVPEGKARSAGRQTETVSLHDTADLRLLRSGAQLLRSPSDAGDLWDLTVEPSTYWHKDLGDSPIRWIAPIDADEVPEPVRGLARGAAIVSVLTERTTTRAWTVERAVPRVAPSAVGTSQPSEDEPGGGEPAQPTGLDTQAVPSDSSAAIEPLIDDVSRNAGDGAGDDADGAAGVQPPDESPEPEPERVLVTQEELAVLRGRSVVSRRIQVRVSGAPALAAAVASGLEMVGGERVAPGIATDDVLGPRARRPLVPEVVTDDRLVSLVQAALGRSVARLLANDVAIRLDLGPEAVHHARVATRRLRSDLRTLRPVLDTQWANVIDREAKWLAGLLGEMRDADVLAERLHERIDDLPARDRDAALPLLDAVAASRSAADEALHRGMASHRYMRLLDGLVEAAESPRVLDPEADSRHVVIGLVAEPWAKLVKKARSAGKHSDIEHLHDLRIRAKRARYGFEMAGLVVDAAQDHADRITGLQDELGELHDAAVADEWLRERVARHGIAGAFVIGQLCAAEQAEIERRRRSWVNAWQRASKHKVSRWLH